MPLLKLLIPQLLIIIGTLLVSLEDIVGKIKLINFFSNIISSKPKEYIKKICRFILNNGILEGRIKQFGGTLVLTGIIIDFYIALISL